MRLAVLSRAVVSIVVASVFLPAMSAMAAFDAYMTIDGAKQGKIVDSVQVTNVTHQTTMTAGRPGLASGQRRHGELLITKKIDVASPKLLRAMSTHEALNNVTLSMHPSGAGKAPQILQLRDAVITNIRKVGDNEEITLSYDTVAVTWSDGGKTATDDWDAR